jgi:hypothetical protein
MESRSLLTSLFLIIVAGALCCSFVVGAPQNFSWVEYAGNPISYTPGGHRLELSVIVDPLNPSYLNVWYRNNDGSTDTVRFHHTRNMFNFSDPSDTDVSTDIPGGFAFPDVILINSTGDHPYYSMTAEHDGGARQVHRYDTANLSTVTHWVDACGGAQVLDGYNVADWYDSGSNTWYALIENYQGTNTAHVLTSHDGCSYTDLGQFKGDGLNIGNAWMRKDGSTWTAVYGHYAGGWQCDIAQGTDLVTNMSVVASNFLPINQSWMGECADEYLYIIPRSSQQYFPVKFGLVYTGSENGQPLPRSPAQNGLAFDSTNRDYYTLFNVTNPDGPLPPTTTTSVNLGVSLALFVITGVLGVTVALVAGEERARLILVITASIMTIILIGVLLAGGLL